MCAPAFKKIAEHAIKYLKISPEGKKNLYNTGGKLKLSYILEKTNYIKYYGDIDIEIENLSSNSNEINKNGIFIAIKGLKLTEIFYSSCYW